MKKSLFAFLMALVLAACAQEEIPQEPPIDTERVRILRETLALCEEQNWQGCDGGFLRIQGETAIYQIINVDPDVTANANIAPHADEMTSSQIMENAAPGEAGDRWLNQVTFIFSSDRALWEAAAIEHARGRLQ